MKNIKKSFFIALVFIASILFMSSTFSESILAEGATQTQTYSNGCLPETPEKLASIPKARKLLRGILPRVMDLTANFPTPGDQGKENSCVGWAVAYAYKSFQEKVERAWDLAYPTHLFSPAYVYNQINGGKDGGSMITDAMDLVVNQGVCSLQDMPYGAGDYLTQPNDYQKQQAIGYKALSYAYISAGDIGAMKSHLAAGDAVILGVAVYDDLSALSVADPIYDNTDGSIRGYHAICLIGYDDSKKAFKFINSWGTGWGLGGYGYISYELVERTGAVAFIWTDITDSSDTTIKLSKKSAVLVKGGTAPLTATISPESAGDRTITWTSSAPDVVTVTPTADNPESATITGSDYGTAVISAAIDGGTKTALCNVTVSKPYVILNESSLVLTPRQTTTLTAITKLNNESDQTISWASSNPDVVAITPTTDTGTATIKALGSGTATISATVANGLEPAVCTVTVTGIALNMTSLALCQSESATLAATIFPGASGKTITWTSTNPDIVAITNMANDFTTATIIAKGTGCSAIIASIDNGAKKAVCNVSVEGSYIIPNSGMLGLWQFDENTGTTVADLSGNGNICTLNGGFSWTTGKFGSGIRFDGSTGYATIPYNQALRPAKVTIAMWVKSNTSHWSSQSLKIIGNDYYCGIKSVSAYYPVPPTKEISFYGITNDGSGPAEVIYTPDIDITKWHLYTGTYDGSYLRLYIDGNLVASTPKTGDLRSIYNAPLYISHWDGNTLNDYFDGSVDTLVMYDRALSDAEMKTLAGAKDGLSNITLNRTVATLYDGDTDTLTATITPSDAANQTVTWTSSDPSVVAITSTTDNPATATIISQGSGTAIVTASLGNGQKTAVCYVNVRVPVTGISLSQTATRLKTGETATLSAKITPSNATNQIVSWTSSNTAVATVSPSVNNSAIATIKTMGVGTVEITAVAEDGLKVAVCDVIVETSLPMPTEGLIGLWDFNEGTGTTVADFSGNGNTCTLNGGFTWTAGKFGSGIRLDGFTGYATVPYNQTLRQAKVTIALWAKSNTSYWNSAYLRLIDMGYCLLKSGSATTPYPAPPTKEISFCGITNDGSAPGEVIYTPDIDITQWHLYAGTYDGSYLRLYIDGNLVASTPKTGDLYPSSNQPLNIGYKNPYYLSDYFDGSVDTLVMYNRALSDAEMKSLYNVQIPVEGISLSQTTARLKGGETVTLSAKITPSKATNQTIAWTSSNAAIVTVIPSVDNPAIATITGTGLGSAIITAAADGGLKLATCIVTVKTPVPGSSLP